MDGALIWTVIVGLGVGSYALRFFFIGIVGDRAMPPWLLRHLRYTAVAIFPGLVAPLVMWPAATQGTLDPARMFAALVTIFVGWWSKNVIAAILTGAATLYFMLWVAV